MSNDWSVFYPGIAPFQRPVVAKRSFARGEQGYLAILTLTRSYRGESGELVLWFGFKSAENDRSMTRAHCPGSEEGNPG